MKKYVPLYTHCSEDVACFTELSFEEFSTFSFDDVFDDVTFVDFLGGL